MSASRIKRESGFVTEVHCICGKPIRSLVDSDKVIRTEKVNNKVVITKLAFMATHANFRQIVMEVQNGNRTGKHVTTCCGNCLSIMGRKRLKRIYDSDMDQMDDEGGETKRLRTFTPVGILKEEVV